MKETITGNDSISKKIILDLQSGLRVSEIPDHYPISIDQAKKLSRYTKILTLAKENLDEKYYERLQLLGLKSLPLSRLFKNADWQGVMDILAVITDKTTRDEIFMLLKGLEEKRKRIAEFKENANILLNELENTSKSLKKREKGLLNIQKELKAKFTEFKQYPEHLRLFFLEYLGLYDGKLVLAKRLNVNWQSSLRKKGIIEYNEDNFVHFIKDFSAFVEALSYCINRGLDYKWNPEKDIPRIYKSNPLITIAEDGKYKVSQAFNEPFNEAIKNIKLELAEIKEKKTAAEKELKAMKSKTIHSYMEMSDISDFLSVMNLKRHKQLQNKALKWLFNRGFIALADFTLPNGKRADIFAYNESEIIIFEVKVSKEDLKNIKKWKEYLPYCHSFYFLTSPELTKITEELIKKVDCGLYTEDKTGLKLIAPDFRKIKVIQEDDMRFAAARKLSQKFIFGY